MGFRNPQSAIRNLQFLAALAMLAASTPASGRAPDGTLDLIRTPNNGIPAIALPGTSFDAVLSEQAELRLKNGDSNHLLTALAVAWTSLPGGRFKAVCTVPKDLPPGAYALEAAAGNRTDVNARAVFVRDNFPEYYLVAHLTDTHIGKTGAAERLRAVLEAVNASQAAFALVTGDLTDGGEPGQFKEFLEILDGCTVPTFVCPGNHDREGGNYARMFGPLAYRFQFGQDGYLGFDTKDFITADSLGAQDADLELFRREIKGARWAIGFTHRYEPNMGMRSQLVLFVDDPLDHLIFGHWHRANDATQKAVPWGKTPITVTPAACDGMFRLFDVSAKGIKGREPQHVGAPAP